MPYFQFQAQNQADRYEEAGAPAYTVSSRLISIKQAAEAAAEASVRQRIAESKARESDKADNPVPANSDDSLANGANSASSATSPSFNCAKANTSSEKIVCSDSVLAALDRDMAEQYYRALKDATLQQRSLLKRTAARFIGYRDRCVGAPCISQTYYNRMREIEDIKAGQWKG
jgi:uncharacterized protein YecT (DUF1311 family)